MISYIANWPCRVCLSSQFSQFMRLIFNELDRLPHVNMIQCKALRLAEQRVLHAIWVYTIPTRNYPQGGGGTPIFSHIRRLGLFFLGSKFWISIFLGVFRKMNNFLGYKDFLDIFWGSSQNWASLRVISMHFRVFFKVKVQNWDIFLGC